MVHVIGSIKFEACIPCDLVIHSFIHSFIYFEVAWRAICRTQIQLSPVCNLGRETGRNRKQLLSFLLYIALRCLSFYKNTGIPHFIVPHCVKLHRCCIFYKLKACSPPSKKITTPFIVIFDCGGLDQSPAVSSRYAWRHYFHNFKNFTSG